MRAAVKQLMRSDAFNAMDRETQDVVVQCATSVFLQHAHARPQRCSLRQQDASEILEAAGARAFSSLAAVQASLHKILTNAGAEVPLHLASKESRRALASARREERCKNNEAAHLASLSEYEMDRLTSITDNDAKLRELGLRK